MVKLPSVSTHSRPKAAEPVRRAKGHPAGFQHTAARRRLLRQTPSATAQGCFNTQPPEGGCRALLQGAVDLAVSTHSRPKAAARLRYRIKEQSLVSTHSRPKAAALRVARQAGFVVFQHTAARRRLVINASDDAVYVMFQHTAARRRLLGGEILRYCNLLFQHTAARRRLVFAPTGIARQPGFNTQPPEGGWPPVLSAGALCAGFNTQPPEGG